jgi:pimeloyl-ACP methyl ester carboxylesterase
VTNKNHVPPQRLEFVRKRFELTSRRSMEDIIVLMKHAPDLRSRLAAVDIPKLVAVGSHDLWPAELHADLAHRIGAELVVYKTGHSPCETTPHALARDMAVLFARA